MSKKLYAAYGSNLNKSQMRFRCPTASLLGIGTIPDYALCFRGRPNNAFATIEPKDGSRVPAAVWEIQPDDERALDFYEGFPRFYFKRDVSVHIGGKDVKAMAYVMDLRMKPGLPSRSYYQTILEGCRDCGLDAGALKAALAESAQRYFSERSRIEQQDDAWETDEAGPLGGMQL